jgi:SAM-dependent methyltransferase
MRPARPTLRLDGSIGQSRPGLRERARAKAAYAALGFAQRALPASTRRDAFHQNFEYFVERLNERDSYSVLEVGSRNAHPDPRFRGTVHYVGADIRSGPNVDVVVDAHELSQTITERFDCIYAISTLEHLAMPWKAVLEFNAVLATGGLLFLATHPTWPPHELPWDFWRFNHAAMHALLNDASGFRILRCDEGLPCLVLPLGSEESTRSIERQRAYMGISVVAQKIGPSRGELSWPVALSEILDSTYPETA